MKKFLLVFLLLSSTICFAEQNLLFFPIESEEVDDSNIRFIEIELHRKLSTYFDLNIEKVNASFDDLNVVVKEQPSRFYLRSSLVLQQDSYVYFYEFFDLIKNRSAYKNQISKNSINELANSFDDVLIKIRSELRKPPSNNNEKRSQVVIQTDSVGADVYFNKKFVGISPISVSAVVGSTVVIEARTESLKKSVDYMVEEKNINEVNLDLEPIVGSFLLRGDVLGRTLHINDDPVEIESSALFRDIPIGIITLEIESEWGTWENSIIIHEERLTEVDVSFVSISKVELEVNNDSLLTIESVDGDFYEDYYESQIVIIPPGEYLFTTSKEEHITESVYITIDPEILHEFITPELAPIEVAVEIPANQEEIVVEETNQILELANKASFWSSVGSGALFTLGVISEIVAINMYEGASLSDDAVTFRETGENLRVFNIAVLSTGVISVITYFVSGILQ